MSVVGAASRGRTSTFRVSVRAGVWQVTRDAGFYGDYLTREAAVASACSAARSFEAAGGSALVLALPANTLIPHHDIRRKP